MTSHDLLHLWNELDSGAYPLKVDYVQFRATDGQTFIVRSLSRWQEIRTAWREEHDDGQREGISVAEVARRTGKNHTTILYAIQKGYLDLTNGGVCLDSLARYLYICGLTKTGRYSTVIAAREGLLPDGAELAS